MAMDIFLLECKMITKNDGKYDHVCVQTALHPSFFHCCTADNFIFRCFLCFGGLRFQPEGQAFSKGRTFSQFAPRFGGCVRALGGYIGRFGGYVRRFKGYARRFGGCNRTFGEFARRRGHWARTAAGELHERGDRRGTRLCPA